MDARQSEKRRKRNLDVKTRLKTIFKKAKTNLTPEVLRGVESQLDKAAQKGIIHPNKAARKKSRLGKSGADLEKGRPESSSASLNFSAGGCMDAGCPCFAVQCSVPVRRKQLRP